MGGSLSVCLLQFQCVFCFNMYECGREMMRNPKVNVDISRFDEPLLSSSAIAELEKEYCVI